MKTPTITCIVPTHKRDALLSKALDSIRDQTWQPDSVIVVDDVPSESTGLLASGFQGLPRIIYVDNSASENHGASSSRNAGAEVASTDFLAFLDDDDRWEPEFLEECVAVMQRSRVDLVTASGTVEIGDERIGRPWLAKRHLTSAQCLAWNPGITGSSFVISTSAFRRIDGFDDRLPVFNDLDFFVRFLAGGHNYAVVARPLFIQTADGVGHLSSRSERRARGIKMYMDKHRSELRWYQRRRLIREIHLARRYDGQRFSLGVYHFVLMWLHSSPGQFLDVVSARLSRRGTMYV